MENHLSPYEKQYMKMAMLKHEETFKQQVYELHRLYQVQKILMRNMKIDKGNNSGLGSCDHETDRLVSFPGGGESGGNNKIEMLDESEIKLTLGPSCYGGDMNMMRMNKKKKDSSPEMMNGLLLTGGRSLSLSPTGSSSNVEEQVRQERLMKHQKQKQPWLQALTLDVI